MESILSEQSTISTFQEVVLATIPCLFRAWCILKKREFWIKLPDNQINRAFRVDLSRLKQKIKSPKVHE
jgi:hypothetical protein